MRPIPGITSHDGRLTISIEVSETRQAVRVASYIYQWASAESERRRKVRAKEEVIRRRGGRPKGVKNGE